MTGLTEYEKGYVDGWMQGKRVAAQEKIVSRNCYLFRQSEASPTSHFFWNGKCVVSQNDGNTIWLYKFKNDECTNNGPKLLNIEGELKNDFFELLWKLVKRTAQRNNYPNESDNPIMEKVLNYLGADGFMSLNDITDGTSEVFLLDWTKFLEMPEVIRIDKRALMCLSGALSPTTFKFNEQSE